MRDIGNTWGHHHPSWTITTPQAMKFPWTTLLLWVGKITTLPGTLKKPSSLEWMTHPSTGTLESFSCHTSGMRCWQDHQIYISNNANNIWHGGNPKPTNTTHGGNPKPTNILQNANNIRQGGNHKSTYYYYRFITSEPQTTWLHNIRNHNTI